MNTTILKSKTIVDSLYSELQFDIKNFNEKYGRPPCLSTILVGKDPASSIYVKKKGETCLRLGIAHKDFNLLENATESSLVEIIEKLNHDNTVDGILVQKPLPKHINERAIFDLIIPQKDVDCFSPTNVGLLNQGRPLYLPCTPAGIMTMLEKNKINPAGMNALIVGRSDIVGKPMASLLLSANATVTIAHSKTKDLADHIALSDLVIAAIGKPKFLTGKLPWKKNCVVIDVGINRTQNGICGDVDFESVKDKVYAITPVPGGVGPTTIAMLMVNTVRSALLHCPK